MFKKMGKSLKGIVAEVDVPKKLLLLKYQEASENRPGNNIELPMVVSWNLSTRVTEAGRGLIPPQQIREGQVISVDCRQDADGRWVAGSIEIIKPYISTTTK